MILENDGWQVFITTPRGKNHAYRTYNAAKDNPRSFAEIISVRESKRFTPEQLQDELIQYIADFGEDFGTSMFEQEYNCSFDAALLGTYWTKEINHARTSGRIKEVKPDPDYPVHSAWDLGRSDDTSIWFYQIIKGRIRVFDYLSTNGKDIEWYAAEVKKRRPGKGILWIPHDGAAETFSSPRSAQEQLADHFGWGNVRIVPSLSIQDGIQAARKTLALCEFDEHNCANGIEALSQYQRKWDDNAKIFSMKPLHNWCSHTADAFRMLAVAWQKEPTPKELIDPKFPLELSIDQLIARQRKRRLSEE
jgi:hypothetical protein